MKTYKDQIVTDLAALGVKQGDNIIFHSSYSAIGKSEKGPEEIIDALLLAIGKTGNLLMPGFGGGLQYSQAVENKIFEVNQTPSQLGIISELFRKNYPTKRSLHPTHSVTGMGPQSVELLAGHENCLISTGNGTPFDKLKSFKGKILLAGVDNRSNTFLHHAENTLGAPTISKNKFTMKVIDYKDNLISVDLHPHFPGLPRCYERLNTELPEAIQKKGKIGKADSFLIDAKLLYEYLEPLIRKNPLYLIKPFQI
jgi:aminoglycoside 3-N-acetyltransferase